MERKRFGAASAAPVSARVDTAPPRYTMRLELSHRPPMKDWRFPFKPLKSGADIGLYPIVTLEKQRLNMIGNLV